MDRFLKNRKPKEKPESAVDSQTRIKLQPGEWDFRLKGPLENKKARIEKQRQAQFRHSKIHEERFSIP